MIGAPQRKSDGRKILLLDRGAQGVFRIDLHAAQAIILIASEKQRRTAMGAAWSIMPTRPEESRKAISCSPSSFSRSGAPSIVTSVEIAAGIQY
jgi:hypothetical protein